MAKLLIVAAATSLSACLAVYEAANAQEITNACTSDQTDASTLQLPSFSNDNYFDLQVRNVGEDRVSIRITGDKIIVDQQTMTSIVANASDAKTKLDSLIIDGRVVEIKGPLSFVNGKIRLQAETLRFGSSGRITLLPSPDSTERRLEILSDNVEFLGSPRRPFDLHLIDVEGGTFQFAALNVRRPESDSSDVTSDYIWKRFVESLEISDIPPGFDVKIGEAAKPTLDEAFQADMEWPLFFAAKAVKHFNRAPFSANTIVQLNGFAETYLEPLSRWREPGPFVALSEIKSSIDGGTDLDGRVQGYTPKQDLTSQLAGIQTAINNDYLEDLISLIVATTKDRDSKDKALATVKQQIAQGNKDQVELQRYIDTDSGLIQSHTQSTFALDESIRQRSDFLAEMSRREFERLKDAQSVKQWTTVATTVVLVAASVVSMNPVLTAVAVTGLAVTGDQIYKHNINQPMTLADLLAEGARAYQASTAFQETWGKFKTQQDVATRVIYRGEVVKEGEEPKPGEPDNRKVISKSEAAKRLLTDLGATVAAARSLRGDEVTGPTPVALSERENEDEEMKGYLARRAELQQEISVLAGRIIENTEALETTNGRLVELTQTAYNLLTIVPENDQQDARWNASAYQLWSLYVERIADQLDLLKKSVYFETGRFPDAPGEVLEYPNELLSQIKLDILDPTGGAGRAAAVADLEARLTEEREKFIVAVQSYAAAADQTLNDYFESRSEADTYRRSVRFSDRSANAAERAFIAALNGQIKQQIVTGTSVEHLLPAFIPFRLERGADPYPERLLRVAVVDVRFNVGRESIGENAFIFSTIHPGYGEMRRGESCFVGDFRKSATDWRYFSTPLEQVTRDWLTREPQRVELSKESTGRFYAYYPARTSYSMIVDVVSERWKAIPEIREIEIGLEIMQ